MGFNGSGAKFVRRAGVVIRRISGVRSRDHYVLASLEEIRAFLSETDALCLRQ